MSGHEHILREARKLRDEVLAEDRSRVPADKVEFAHQVGFSPDLWQQMLLRSASDRVILNISRQAGKSTMAALLALHQALYHPGSLILLMAPALRQSQELYGKVRHFYGQVGHAAPEAIQETALTMRLANGSRIVSLPGNEKNVRGYSNVTLLIVDEAARVEDDLYFSVRPMLAVSGGRLLLLSTPYGKRGVFYEAWTGEEDWERYEVSAYEVPRISPEFLEEERRTLGEHWYAQEYECTFGDMIFQVFSDATIAKLFDVTDEDDIPLVQ